MSSRSLRIVYFSIVAAVVVLDQASKQWAAAVLRRGEDIDVVDGFLKLTYAENPGIAFSFFNSGTQGTRWILVTFSLAAAIGVVLYALKQDARLVRVQTTFALLLGGIVGNLIDRAMTGRVIDFIDAYVGTHHWPTFNIADSAISVGAVLLALELFRTEEGKKPESVEEPSS